MEVENIEYNKDNGLDVTVYLNKKRGNASTTDLSADALHDCVKSAISIAGYSNEDPCAGVADKDLICTEFKELDLVFENDVDADFATDFAISLEKEAKAKKANGIKKSDGASFDSTLYTGVIANSNGFAMQDLKVLFLLLLCSWVNQTTRCKEVLVIPLQEN